LSGKTSLHNNKIKNEFPGNQLIIYLFILYFFQNLPATNARKPFKGYKNANFCLDVF